MTRLPVGWASTSLGDPFSWASGGTPSRSHEINYGGNIPWVVIGDLNDGVVTETSESITEAGLSTSSAKWVEDGTVLLAMYGSIGKLGIAGRRLTTNQAIAFTQPPRGVSNRYLFYYLMSRRSMLLGEGKGGTQSNISQTVIKAFPFVCAPTNEQHRIVEAIDSYLTRLDAAVTSLERAQAKLKAYRASVLKAAVEGRLVRTEASLARAEKREYEPAEVLLARILKERRRRWEEAELARLKAAGKTPKDDKWKAKYEEAVPPDTSTLPKLPEGWCWASCAQVLFRLQTGPFGSSLHRSDYVAGGTPVINPQHLQDDGIHPSSQVAVAKATVARLSMFRLSAGDIVLGRRGEMGRCAVVTPKEDGWLLGTGSLALRLVQDVDGDYFSWVLRSPRTVRTLESKSVGTTMTNLNQAILLGLPVPLPPTTEQVRIAQEIERQLSVIEELESSGVRQQTRCGRLRQAILKWAFEGKLVDQDPSEEPAEKLLVRIRAERAATSPTKRTPVRQARGAA
jgi:type I restriction enzyme S subunit